MAVMEDIRNIVVLTGAGISAESGLATFRGPDGLWEGHSVEDVCTPEALRRDPELVHRFYDERRAKLHNVKSGRGWGRERVCQYVYTPVVVCSVKKKKKQ